MKWFRHLFTFSASDRRVMSLLLTVLFALVAWLAFSLCADTTNAGPAGDARPRDGGQARNGARNTGCRPYAVEGQKAERFCFDPNTADSTALLRLGLQPWQVRSIYRYRAKGGVFHRPVDFARLYGLTVKQYRELEPYIRIGADYRLAADVYGVRGAAPGSGERGAAYGAAPLERGGGMPGSVAGTSGRAAVRDTVKYPVKLRPGQHIALNASDTALLKKVPGIGSYYARKVVAYRQRLGGFHSVAQLREIEGFPEGALPYFKAEGGAVKKLNVNRLSLSQLRQHPYLNYYQARDIVDYRRLRGPITDISQLRLLNDFTDTDLERLRPYLEY